MREWAIWTLTSGRATVSHGRRQRSSMGYRLKQVFLKRSILRIKVYFVSRSSHPWKREQTYCSSGISSRTSHSLIELHSRYSQFDLASGIPAHLPPTCAVLETRPKYTFQSNSKQIFFISWSYDKSHSQGTPSLLISCGLLCQETLQENHEWNATVKGQHCINLVKKATLIFCLINKHLP